MKRKTRTERKCKNVPKKKQITRYSERLFVRNKCYFHINEPTKKNVNYVCQKNFVSIKRKTLPKIM